MNTNFDNFLQDNRRATDIVLFVLSVVSGYFTYQGALLALDQSNFVSGFSGSAFAFSTGVTAALFLFWRYALGIVPKMKTASTRLLGIGVVLLGGGFIVALSSWMNVMALAGAGAQEAHMRSGLKQYDQSLQSVFENARRVDRLIPDLEMAANQYANLARAEIRQGTLSGTAGKGGVADSLNAVRTKIKGLISTIRSSSNRAKTLRGKGQKYLKEMSGVLDSNKAITLRLSKFGDLAGELNRVIGDLNNHGLYGVVSRAMRGLAASTGLHGVSENNTRIASAQKNALARIVSDLKQTGEVIGNAADQLAKDAKVEHSAFERVGVAMAVFSYAGSLIPYWAGGIGLDLMPVVLILMLMLLSAASGNDTVVGSEIDGMSFGQVRQALSVLEGLRGVAQDQATMPVLDHQSPANTLAVGNSPDEKQSGESQDWTEEQEEEWKNYMQAT